MNRANPEQVAADAHSLDLMALMGEVMRRGITLEATDDGTLRFHPRSAMMPDLTERIRANKTALIAMLRRKELTDNTSRENEPTGPEGPESGVSSVLSVSEPGDSGKALWSEAELELLDRAGTSREELPLVVAVKNLFADVGATVVAVESAKDVRPQTRRRVAQLIRYARAIDRKEAVALWCAWRERVAICTIDGGVAIEAAEDIAWAELESSKDVMAGHQLSR